MDFVDVKYINLISSRFQKFKRVKNNLYNFRCPICGDSQTNKNKARGYLYQIKNNTNYKCHNCGVNVSFNNFLKQIDTEIHKQYIFEKFKEGNTGKNFTTEAPVLHFEAPKFKQKLNLPKASENPDAKAYLENRKLNSNNYYYAERFKEWTNSLRPTFDFVGKDEPRIIIPLFYQNTLVDFKEEHLVQTRLNTLPLCLLMMHLKSMDSMKSKKTPQSTSPKDHLTQHSFQMRLLFVELMVILISGVLTILFGYTITNHVIQKSYQEFPVLSKWDKKLSSGLQQ